MSGARGGSDYGRRQRTLPAGIKRLHVEDVDTLHLSEDFKTLETGGLLDIGGDGALLGSGGEKVVVALDLCGFLACERLWSLLGGRARRQAARRRR